MRNEPAVMTNDEILDLDVTPELAEQALEHTRERARYALDMRHKIETRAATLLRAFLTLALAIVGYGITVERVASGIPVPNIDVWRFVLSAAPLFLAAGCMVIAIWDRNYGTLGGEGDMWLRKGAIDGDPAQAAYFNAMLAASYERRNRLSFRANWVAIVAIRCGLALSLVTPVSLLIFY